MMKRTMLFLSTFTFLMLLSAVAFAQGAADNAYTVAAFTALAEGLAIGIAAAGGGLAQGRAASAALEGISRNPNAAGKIFTPYILGLALIESLVIYALVIAIFLNGHISGILAAG
jgi:F-type H+-transporting ATPase subunit c